MYLDSAYIAKYYVNEPDASAVRALIRRAPDICSSSWTIAEVTCVFHRHIREGSLTLVQGRELIDLFRNHITEGIWNLLPVTNALLLKTATLIRRMPQNIPLRAGEAIHLASALEAGETEIWSNDRQLLAAAAHVGLSGKTASA